MRAYFDESGHAEDPNCLFMGMAGFVAPSQAWELLEVDWLRTLRDHGLSEPFHMKDCAHFTGQFAGWPEARRRALLAALLDCIERTRAAVVGSVVYLPDYDSLTADVSLTADERIRIRLEEPYYITFHHCTVGALIEAGEASDGPLDIVYSWNEEFGTNIGGWAARLWEFMKRHPSNKQLGCYTTSRPAECPALQAADLFAYELCHDYENQVRRGGERMRYPLRRILAMQTQVMPLIKVFDRPELLARIRKSPTDEDRSAPGRATLQSLDWTTNRGEWKELPDEAIALFGTLLGMPPRSEGSAALAKWRDALLTAGSRGNDCYLRLAAIYWHGGYVKEARSCYRRYVQKSRTTPVA